MFRFRKTLNLVNHPSDPRYSEVEEEAPKYLEEAVDRKYISLCVWSMSAVSGKDGSWILNKRNVKKGIVTEVD
jgi:hypothetical protein